MNRKKISLKGALLALAVSVPSLISTVAFTATNQSNNQSHLLFDNKTSSSLPELYNQDLSINPNVLASSVNININQAYSLSFVDSTNDRDYPHAHDPNVYINPVHDAQNGGIKNKPQYSPTITFAEIDVKKMFNLNSVKDFFSLYNLTFTFTYRLNIWISNLADWKGWKLTDGKQTADSIDKVIWNANDDKTNWLRSEELGDLEADRKAYAEVRVFMTYYPTVIRVQGQALSAYNWIFGSLYNHAAFALLNGNSLRAELKAS